MSNALDSIRNRKRRRVPARKDPLTADSIPALSQPVETLYYLSLDEVQDRAHDSREVNQEHVLELVESISAVGLIVPITLDQNRVLLAGAHRLNALRHIHTHQSKRFKELFPQGKIPAYLMSLNQSQDRFQALRVEIEENEKRRDYTPQEVREVAQQLIDEGYVQQRGRPREGQKPLIPALELIFGKSKATIKRYLAQTQNTDSHSEKAPVKHNPFLKLKRQITKGHQSVNDVSNLSKKQKAKWKETQALLKQASQLLEELAQDLE